VNKPEGLNGKPVFAAEDVPVGRIDGGDYGYRRSLLVTVSVRMEERTRRDSYETVNHDQVSRPLDFSIMTGVWNPNRSDIVSGGATVEPLRELVSFERGFDAESARKLADLGAYHLSGMRAGCAHQKRDAGLDSAACPVTGYKWGSAWLVQPLPSGFLERVKALFKDADAAHLWAA
jgi:hypothetical protein